jgi:hypothetical protein
MNAAKKAAAPKPKERSGRVAPFKQAEITWCTPWLDRSDEQQMVQALSVEMDIETLARLNKALTAYLKEKQNGESLHS